MKIVAEYTFCLDERTEYSEREFLELYPHPSEMLKDYLHGSLLTVVEQSSWSLVNGEGKVIACMEQLRKIASYQRRKLAASEMVDMLQRIYDLWDKQSKYDTRYDLPKELQDEAAELAFALPGVLQRAGEFQNDITT